MPQGHLLSPFRPAGLGAHTLDAGHVALTLFQDDVLVPTDPELAPRVDGVVEATMVDASTRAAGGPRP